MHFRRRFEPGDDGIDPDKKKAGEFDQERRALNVSATASHFSKRIRNRSAG